MNGIVKEFVVVVGHDLVEKDGVVSLGPSTERACEYGMDLAVQRTECIDVYSIYSDENDMTGKIVREDLPPELKLDPWIVVTAGHSQRYGDVHMAKLMAHHLTSYILRSPYIPKLIKRLEVIKKPFPFNRFRPVIGCASRFNTSGEMEAIAQMARQMKLKRIILVTKWWHGPRCWLLCRYWLLRNGLRGISIFVSPYYDGMGLQQEVRNASRELLIAIPWNLVRGFIPTVGVIIRRLTT